MIYGADDQMRMSELRINPRTGIRALLVSLADSTVLMTEYQFYALNHQPAKRCSCAIVLLTLLVVFPYVQQQQQTRMAEPSILYDIP